MARVRFVKIIDVKDQFAFGRRKSPKGWQSPQACTRMSETNVTARSLAWTIAKPRKNANGDSSMREPQREQRGDAEALSMASASRFEGK